MIDGDKRLKGQSTNFWPYILQFNIKRSNYGSSLAKLLCICGEIGEKGMREDTGAYIQELYLSTIFFNDSLSSSQTRATVPEREMPKMRNYIY